jgi:RimJ/RimL family protein N-acetyltransferase
MKKVTLVPITLENLDKHIDNIMTWVNDPEVTFYFASMQKKISKPEEIVYLHGILSSKYDKLYSVFNSQHEYVGQVSVNKIDWIGETGRMFLVVSKEQQGKDYARPIIQAIQKKAFEDLNLNKLYLKVIYGNKKERLYVSCGFRAEGVNREEYKVRGVRYDMTHMAVLKSEGEERWW